MATYVVVIEHLEPCINRWLLSEYEYAAKIYKSRIMFTNVKKPSHREILSAYAEVREESVTDILKDNRKVVVLDPKADRVLEPEELAEAEYVIIGGIMGSHPPKGRTWLYISSKLPYAHVRNIGPLQYTIAGSIYVLKNIELGKRVKDLKFVQGLSITRRLAKGIELEILLPYAFPLDEHGNIVLPDGYLEIVAEYTPIYESRVLSRREDGIC